MPILLALLLQADARPAGPPVPEPSTLHSLGVVWTIQGDANRNAVVKTEVRRAGTVSWKQALPLFRIERGAAKTSVPPDAWLFAGSVVGLDPDTEYDLRLLLEDPDGAREEQLLKLRTRGEPKVPAGMAEIRVAPGKNALRNAQRGGKPGTLFLPEPGTFSGFNVTLSGEPGRPVVFRGAGPGETVIDGEGASNVIVATGVHDVWFENLTIRNALKAVNAGNSARIVLRRCRIREVSYGLFCTTNERGDVEGFFISDNVMEGPSTWPRTKGIESARAIQVTGVGHDICHNRLRGFADGVDTMPSPRCAAIDIYRNEIEVMTDDGIELDFAERNVRCFENRLTNVFQGISAQPVHGGPAYFFRNVLYNVALEPFKLHQSPSGVLLYHNTVVKRGVPFQLLTPDAVRNSVSRNNLFVGSPDAYAVQLESPMEGCDFDRDGFSGGPWKLFLKWNNARFESADQARRKAPAYRNAVVAELPDFEIPENSEKEARVGFEPRLRAASPMIDAGEPLPGFNDDWAGKGPDLGAHEAGTAFPAYGPRR